MNRPIARARFRGSFGTLDQVFSSMSNGLILYAVAVVSTAQYFGRISLLLTLLAAAVGCMRGALGTALLLKAADQVDEIRREGSYAVTAALLVSPLLAGGMWLLAGGRLGTATVLIAVATPLVLVQDVLRYVAIAEGRPHIAAVWDGLWFFGSVALLIPTWLDWSFVDVNVLIGGWAVLATVALLGLAVTMRIGPRFRHFFGWLRNDWQHRLRYGIDAGLEQGTVFLMLALVTVLVSPVATAALRGATALLAPLAMLLSAIPLFVIPESTRRSASPAQVWRTLTRIAMVWSSITLVVGVVIRVLPDSIGRLLLGNSFGLAQNIVLIIAIEYAIAAWAGSLMVWLKTFNRSAALLTVKVAYATVMASAVVGASLIIGNATGVAVAMAVSTMAIASTAIAVFAPWRVGAGKADAEQDLSTEPVPSRKSTPVWQYRVVGKYGYPSRAMPDYVQRVGRSARSANTSSWLIAIWTFAILGVIGPLLIIQLTGPVDTISWTGPLLIAVMAAARFSWIIGLGERRLCEIMFWSFTYPFMGLAPMTQVREQTWPIIVPRSDFELVWPTFVIVLIGTLALLLGVIANRASGRRPRLSGATIAALSRSRTRGSQTATAEAGGEFTVRNNRVVVLSVLAIAFNLYYSYKIGWIQFTQSRVDLNRAGELAWPSSTVMIFVRAATYMSLLVAWVALVRFRREAKRAALTNGIRQSASVMRVNLLLIVVISLLLANSLNPISNARYLSGTAILAVAAGLGLFATVTSYRLSALGFLAALLIIFPVMDAFRYGKSDDFSDANPLRAFLSPDYDSFAQIANGYLIVEREGINVLRQFLGVVLFWVPRVFWQDKPVDTGIYIAESRGYIVTNLSAPLWIEIFMNGGYILLIVAMFALGYFMHAWDTRLDKQLQLFRMPSVLGAIVPFYTFILLRGSLLQAMPFLMVTIVCWLFVRARRTRVTQTAGAAVRLHKQSEIPTVKERRPAHV